MRAVQTRQVWRLAVQATTHRTAQHKMWRGSAVVGAVGVVLPRPAAKLAEGHHQRALPGAQLGQGRLQRHQAIGQLFKQSGMLPHLVLVRVKTAQREGDDGHTSLPHRFDGLAGHHLCGGTHTVAKRTGREHGAEVVACAAQAAGGGVDVALDLQQVVQRRVVLAAVGKCGVAARSKPGLVHKRLGVVQAHGTGAGQRAELAAADQHTLGGEVPFGSKPGLHATRGPAVRQVFSGFGRGLPNLDRAEMRQIGLGVTHTLHDAQLAFRPQRQQRFKGRMQTGAGVERHHLVGLQSNGGAQLVVRPVNERHHGVQPVVATLEFDQNQNSVGHRRRPLAHALRPAWRMGGQQC